MSSFVSKYLHLALFAVLACIVGGCAGMGYVSYQSEVNAGVVLPDWAPAYGDVNLVRYYYFPDIECYYDVWNQDFVYL